jgi:CRP-like cAMP-binding protein
MLNGSALSGNLKFINLGELLQLLGGNGSNGILTVTSQYVPSQAKVYLENGNPVNASCGALGGLDALNALFGWIDADFEFAPQPLYTEHVINKSRMEIILDALRLLDDGEIQKVGPVDSESNSSKACNARGALPLLKGPLIDYMFVVDEEGYTKDELIVSQGNYGSWIWVILEGQADIIKHTSQGDAHLLRIGEGTFVGSLAAFLMSGSSRSVTVTASGAVQLGVLDTPRLSNEYACMSTEFRKFVLSLDRRLRFATEIAAGYYFDDYSFAGVLKGKKKLDPRQGGQGALSTITAGEAVLVRQGEKGPVPCLTLYPGDFIGNVPFLELGLEPHSVDVFASTDFSVGSLDAYRLQKEFLKYSTTMRNVISHLANSINVTTLIAQRYFNEPAAP